MKRTTLALLFGVGTARKRLSDNRGVQVNRPQVRDCEPACVFGQMEAVGDQAINDFWCFEFTDPHLQYGWEWEQNFSRTTVEPLVDYWQLTLQPYAQMYMYVKMTLDVSRLYFNEFIVDMPEWKAIGFFNVIFNQDYKMCYGLGWEHEAV